MKFDKGMTEVTTRFSKRSDWIARSSPAQTFSDRLARAELLNDKVFFIHLRSALKGPLKKHWEALHDLRYAIAILREMGFDSLSDLQLEDLFVNKLKLYPKHESARKNLRKHFYEAKKVSTTSK